MSIDIEFLKRAYFYIDKPVKYILRSKQEIEIFPVKVKDYEFFTTSCGILSIDKNSFSDVKIIQMSYLQFLTDFLLKEDINKQKLLNIFILCFKKPNLFILFDENKKPFITDLERNILINAKDFEDIRRIILYQNLLHFDDSYINPEMKEAINEHKELKNKNIEPVTLERKISIISSHTGITKEKQLEMTIRSHDSLFSEVCGEIEFITTRTIMAFNRQEIDHWIFKKKKDKLEEYITDVDKYTQSMGGKNSIKKSSNSDLGDGLMNQFNKFNN